MFKSPPLLFGEAVEFRDGSIKILQVFLVVCEDGFEDSKIQGLVIVNGYISESGHLFHLSGHVHLSFVYWLYRYYTACSAGETVWVIVKGLYLY